MKVVLVGATGTIGKAIATELSEHEIVAVSHSGGEYQIDIDDSASVKAMFEEVGPVDAVISATGKFAFGALDELSDEDIKTVIDNKLFGNIKLFRIARPYINEGGSFTFTTGIVSRIPAPGASPVAAVNAGLESFAASAALETGEELRVNAVSPRFVKETMEAMGMDSSTGISAVDTAKAYRHALESTDSGQTLDVIDYI